MRTLALAALTMVTAFGATQADAQRLGGSGQSYPGASYPAPTGPTPPVPRMQTPPMVQPGRPNPGPRPVGQFNRNRWGGNAGGHWIGGVNAPGGWNGYRRPSRGYHVPGYWQSSNFFLGDYAGYGLVAPPQGYNWYRYYDDAVLLDSRGRVYDSVDGVNWDGGYAQGGYAQGGYGADGYSQGGGYAQNDGYARSEAYSQGGGYNQQYQPYPPRGAPLPPVIQNGPVTTYATGGYPGATTTVVTINPAPTVITTTTTEYVEETRTRYVAPRRVYHAPKRRYYRPARKCACRVEQPVLGS